MEDGRLDEIRANLEDYDPGSLTVARGREFHDLAMELLEEVDELRRDLTRERKLVNRYIQLLQRGESPDQGKNPKR